jgi:hypothetical protein
MSPAWNGLVTASRTGSTRPICLRSTELLALREAEVDKDLAAVREAAGRVNATAASLELVR